MPLPIIYFLVEILSRIIARLDFFLFKEVVTNFLNNENTSNIVVSLEGVGIFTLFTSAIFMCIRNSNIYFESCRKNESFPNLFSNLFNSSNNNKEKRKENKVDSPTKNDGDNLQQPIEANKTDTIVKEKVETITKTKLKKVKKDKVSKETKTTEKEEDNSLSEANTIAETSSVKPETVTLIHKEKVYKVSQTQFDEIKQYVDTLEFQAGVFDGELVKLGEKKIKGKSFTIDEFDQAKIVFKVVPPHIKSILNQIESSQNIPKQTTKTQIDAKTDFSVNYFFSMKNVKAMLDATKTSGDDTGGI